MDDLSRSESSIEVSQRLTHQETHLSDLTAVVVRHWLLVVLIAGFIGGGSYYSGRRIIPRYRSMLTVQINSPKQEFVRPQNIDVDRLARRTDPILSELLVLTTQDLALRVADAVNLQIQLEDPKIFRGDVMAEIAIDTAVAAPGSFQLVIDDRRFQLRNALGNVIAANTIDQPVTGPGFSFHGLPQEQPVTLNFRIVPREVAAASVTAGLSYQVRKATNAVDIWFSSTDLTLVPLILNDAVVQLQNMGVRRSAAAARARREYIEQQLELSDSRYRQSIRDLQKFKESQQINNLSSQANALVQALGQLERDRQLALVRISTVQHAMAASDSIGVETLNRLAAIEGIERNAALSFQIRGLLQLYENRRALTALGLRENNPQISSIDERIRQGHTALRRAVDAMLDGTQARVNALEQEIADQRASLLAFPGMESRIGQLTLESAILREAHQYLLRQFQIARMQEATSLPHIQVLDGASPAYREGINVRQRVILGTLVGLLLGLAGAFFLEYLDQTLKTRSDIERLLGIPVLGMIPHDPKLMHQSSGRGAGVVTIDRLDPAEPVVEAYRDLRTNVTFVGADEPLQFIAVTSPGPSEGKTTTATNLALILAETGSRTVLIDGDLRRSTVHRSFGVDPEPGLTDVLIGQASAREAIRPEVVPALDLLSCGSTPPNPAVLLGSSAMDTLIAELRGDYDHIIIDTPPLLPVTDAAVVATNADAVILVLRSGDTDRDAAQRAVDQLGRVRARIAGAVLNAVSHSKDLRYTYYSYRRDAPSRSRLQAALAKLAGIT